MQHIQEAHKVAQDKLQSGETLYVLLDAACKDNAFGLIFSLQGVKSYRSLYLGTRYEPVMGYGPLLAHVEPHGEFFQWFFNQGPFCHAGGFFFSAFSVPKLYEQFRQFLEARMPDGSRALFRFYDPRITKRGIILMSDAERECFLDGISAYYISRYTIDSSVYWRNLLNDGEDNV